MNTFQLRVFQREVKRQCKFALIAFHDLEESLQHIEHSDHDRVWYSIQAILVAAGNISKLLWPPRPKMPDRGEKLRASLSVKESSPLMPRVFRNHFEHFDERLETWAESSKQEKFVDANIMSLGMIGGFSNEDCLRNLDPTTLSITFRGDEYPLKPILEAIRELYETAVIESDKPAW